MVVGCVRNSSGRLQPPTPEDCPGDVWALIQQCTSGKAADRPTAKVHGPCQTILLVVSVLMVRHLPGLCKVQVGAQPRRLSSRDVL